MTSTRIIQYPAPGAGGGVSVVLRHSEVTAEERVSALYFKLLTGPSIC